MVSQAHRDRVVLQVDYARYNFIVFDALDLGLSDRYPAPPLHVQGAFSQHGTRRAPDFPLLRDLKRVGIHRDHLFVLGGHQKQGRCTLLRPRFLDCAHSCDHRE